jgi:hypothetical protein
LNAARSAGGGVRHDVSKLRPLILIYFKHFPKFSPASGERPILKMRGELAVNAAC